MGGFNLLRETHYGDRVVTCFADRPKTVHGLLASAVDDHPRVTALVCGEERLTYAGLDAEVARVAGGLAALGMGRGDRVALLLGNGIPFVVLTYAVARLGAIGVPISIREQMPGVRHILADSGAAIIVTEADLTHLIPPAGEVPELRLRIAMDKAEGCLDYEGLRAGDSITKAADLGEDDVATILYTSGTTGAPKGAMLTGLGIVHSATNYQLASDLTPGEAVVIVVPLSHVTGIVAGIHVAVRAAGTMVIEPAFDAERFLRVAARERLVFTVMVPAMYNLLLLRADFADYDLSPWRLGGFGGAPMPEPTIVGLAERLPNLGLMNCYGATETTSPVTLMPPDQTAARPLSVGLPVNGADIRVVDTEGRDVPVGEIGELWHGGAMVVPGYWGNPAATAAEFSDGFWKSGDLGSKDTDGFVYVHDRIKDMINRGGYKVYTAQVESVLLSVVGVREAAVIAKPCPVLGERVHAVVRVDPDGGPVESELAARCEAALADYQRPESYTFTTEPLPRNANGKIVKRRLREELAFADPA